MIARIRCPGAAVLALALGAPLAAANLPVVYLAPSTFSATSAGDIELRAESGPPTATQTIPWPEEELGWFFVRGGGRQENRPTLAPVERGGPVASVPITQPGVTVLAFDTKPVVVAVPADELKAFFRENVAGAAGDPTGQALAPGTIVRVRRCQSATTLVRLRQPGAAPTPSATAMSKRGQQAEIRLLVDPTMPIVGGDLPVKIYVRGTKRAGVLVQATCLTTGKTMRKTTNPSGVTHFRITDPGVWRIQFHDARPAAEGEADWVLYSSTLTFEVPPKGAAK